MRTDGLPSPGLSLTLPGPHTGVLQSSPEATSPGTWQKLSRGLLEWSGRNTLDQNPWFRPLGASPFSKGVQAATPLPPFANAIRTLQQTFGSGGLARGLEQATA